MQANLLPTSKTFVLEHNPNCPSPFMIRFVGKGKGVIDKLPPGQSRDRIGYGQTIKEAVKQVYPDD